MNGDVKTNGAYAVVNMRVCIVMTLLVLGRCRYQIPPLQCFTARWFISRKSHECREELGEIGRAQTRDRVPARGGGEALSPTARVGAVRDVVERVRKDTRVKLYGPLSMSNYSGTWTMEVNGRGDAPQG